MATILLADDNPRMREFVGLHMNLAGHDVAEAGSGAEALRQVARVAPDLVILDQMMPKGDGMSVLRKLRSQARTRELPVMMLTARSRSEDKIDAFDAGADDYVVKPFHPGELASRVARLLNRRER